MANYQGPGWHSIISDGDAVWVALPPTKLVFDPDNHTSCLGEAEAAVLRRKAAQTADRIEQEILTRAGSAPSSTRDEIFNVVTGNATLKNKIFRRLEEEGLQTASGGGVRGDPYRYVVAVPVE